MTVKIEMLLCCLLMVYKVCAVEPLQFNLIVTYFDDNKREEEFRECFEKNIANRFIKKVYVLYENFTGKVPQFMCSPKVEIFNLPHYPRHRDFYDCANKFPGELVIIANTDIFFDETLYPLRHVDFDGTAVILTRWNFPSNAGVRRKASHDAWIFKAPLKYLDGRFKTNVFGNESMVYQELRHARKSVINPSLTVKAWHIQRDFHRDIGAINPGYYHLGVPSSRIIFTSLPD